MTYRQRAEWRLHIGVHPFGLPLAKNGKTCGDCAHKLANQKSRIYWKCDLMANTLGPATDLRLHWPACVEFEEKKK